jgi:N4-gp56 family major capsid protein
MAFTDVAALTNAVKTKFQTGFLVAAKGTEVWGQFVDWESITEGQGGSSFDFGAFEEMQPALEELTETSDLVPVALTDDNMTITPKEYGNSAAPTMKLRWQARTKVREDTARLIGQNRARSVDRLIRNGILAGSNVRYPGTVGVRTGLDATSDKVDLEFLLQLHTQAMVNGIEPWQGDTFALPTHPALLVDILQLTEFKEVQYRHPNEIFKGLPGFTFAGFRFIPHKWGKIYLSGGTLAQATTLNGAVAAGATSIIVTSAAGLAVGDYITLGALEATLAEQVQITVIAGTTLTVRGGGNSPNNVGTRYAHASGEAVTEAANVCALPVIGRNSIMGVHGASVGRYGQTILKEGLDLANRFIYHTWYWYGGVGIWERHIIRGEVAVATGISGSE